jgi:hypothetical protein
MTKHKSKNIGNPNDDDFEELTNDTGGAMAQFDDYRKFDVDAKGEKVLASVKKLIVSLVKLHVDTDKLTDDDYIKAVAEVEQQNLLVLCKQVYYAEHVVDTLIRRLDSGGFVDPELYDQIRQMQMSVIKVTLEVSRYTRQLPEYFKFVNTEIGKINAMQLMSASSDAIETTFELQEAQKSTSFNHSMPMRGTRELMLDISDSISDIDAKIQEAEAIEPTPIILDDDYDDDFKQEDEDDDI